MSCKKIKSYLAPLPSIRPVSASAFNALNHFLKPSFSLIYTFHNFNTSKQLNHHFPLCKAAFFPLMSAFSSMFSYKKLKHEHDFDDYEDVQERVNPRLPVRLRRRKRFKVKIPRLRKYLKRKVKALYGEILKRLRESQVHFSDLFAGNYLFLQVNPTSIKSLHKSYNTNCALPRVH